MRRNQGFPVGSVVKNMPTNAGDERDMGSIPEWGRFPGEGNGSSIQYSCLGNQSHGQRSLAGYTPWGCKESDMTEHSPMYERKTG